MRIQIVMRLVGQLLFIFSAFFRVFDLEMLESFRLQIPQWLESIHGVFNLGA